MVPSDTAAFVEAIADGAALVWLETPSNPRLDVVDIAAVAEAAHAAGAVVGVDNTVATPLGQQPLAHGADLAMLSGTKSLSGHSDVLLGAVSATDPERAADLRRWRSESGSILGGFEAWLAHRSLATLGLRLERSSVNAAAVAELLRGRDGVADVVHPSGPVVERQMTFTGPLCGFDLGSAERAQAFLSACRLSQRRPPSAASTRWPSGARGGASTRSRRASSASPPAARTRPTCSPTSSGRSMPCSALTKGPALPRALRAGVTCGRGSGGRRRSMGGCWRHPCRRVSGAVLRSVSVAAGRIMRTAGWRNLGETLAGPVRSPKRG